MRMRQMRPRRMQQPGHYRRPQLALPGRMNTPRRGRPGKLMPSMKKMGPQVRRGR
jgi:hypothetical protein